MAAEAEYTRNPGKPGLFLYYRDEVTGRVAFRFPSAVRLLRGIRPRGGCGRLRLLGGVPADSVKMAVKLECPHFVTFQLGAFFRHSTSSVKSIGNTIGCSSG